MTNKERQTKLDKTKWLVSEKFGIDTSGKMDYCLYCPYRFIDWKKENNCKAKHCEREKNNYCATAYNRMEKQARSKLKIK